MDEMSSIGASMYHSAVGSIFGTTSDNSVLIPDQSVPDGDSESDSSTSLSTKRTTSEQRKQSLLDANQRLLIASEKQISAKLSINEVLLSLSSGG